ncbi:3-hydroxybutyrate dehydrogenase [Actinopolyspora halophila]|uniref:3-hydroxybutyrate dehydrogenase n=1 Tax=Actinopolyspora halophila TaxID=1850 RepID=UPI0003798BA9|nr:3-hydroxybutyrate dehydrogenase [Actinopolyspora halophila]
MGESSAAAFRPQAGSAGELAGKRALVTGAGSGIGAAVSRRLAKTGADVLLADRAAESLETVASEIGARHTVVDLSEPEAVAGLGEDVDIVINNAGLQHVAPVHQYPPEMFSLLLDVMVQAPFRIIRAALPGMYRRGWGRIVNISSVHGLRASPLKSAYVTAKHGLEGLSKTVAVEGAEHGVTSNCICPGYVRTPLVEQQVSEHAVRHRVPREQVIDDVLLARTPVKRLVEPEEVAELAVWLCGDSAVSVTGSSFPMDGGRTAY